MNELRKKTAQPSSLEMQVLSVLWEQGPATARQVQESLPDKKERAYTTVLSVMQVMEKKRLLRHETEGNRHVYIPTVRKRAVLGAYWRSLIANLFGGSAALAVQQLLQTTPISDQELEEMRAVLDTYARRSTSKEEKKP